MILCIFRMGKDGKDPRLANKPLLQQRNSIAAKLKLGVSIGFQRNEAHKKEGYEIGANSTIQGLEKYVNVSRHANVGLEVSPTLGSGAVMLDENDFRESNRPCGKEERQIVAKHLETRLQDV